MVTFRGRLIVGLKARDVEVCDDLEDTPYQAVLIIGGTRNLPGLWRARSRGIPIVQRLDGINWLHRFYGIRGKRLRIYLRAEYGNFILRTIRARLASRVVYQSLFAHHWWERVNGSTRVPCTVIYNGVDLNAFKPDGKPTPPEDLWRILMVEGNLMGGYEHGLQAAVEFAERLGNQLQAGFQKHPGLLTSPDHSRPVELMVVGRVAPEIQKQWEASFSHRGFPSNLTLTWVGLVPADRIPEINRSAHLLYAADVNPACPNAVIEALACGLPVIAFDTGSLPELVTNASGRLVPYGGDPWRLERPDVDSLTGAAVELLDNLNQFRKEARARAEAVFGLDRMVEAYLDILSDH
jgi:glycosyltransferase involved in cell wall biosynthesis